MKVHMHTILWKRYTRVAVFPHTCSWLTIQAHLGLAPNTLDAYGRALEDYLAFSASRSCPVENATRELCTFMN